MRDVKEVKEMRNQLEDKIKVINSRLKTIREEYPNYKERPEDFRKECIYLDTMRLDYKAKINALTYVLNQDSKIEFSSFLMERAGQYVPNLNEYLV